jgi:hypothetical protein
MSSTIYDNIVTKFINIKNSLYASHSSIKNFYYGHMSFYGKDLDSFVNTTIYTFLEYISYNINKEDIDIDTKNRRDNLYELNNYIRKDFILKSYTEDEYKIYFIKKIKTYFIDINDVLNNLMLIVDLL